MLLAISLLLKRGIGFWPALAAGCVLTVVLYVGMTVMLGAVRGAAVNVGS